MREVTFTIFKKFNLNSNNIIIALSTVSYFWVQLVIVVIKEKLNFCLEICIINSINYSLYPKMIKSIHRIPGKILILKD
jgi:hypothetical protein